MIADMRQHKSRPHQLVHAKPMMGEILSEHLALHIGVPDAIFYCVRHCNEPSVVMNSIFSIEL